MSYTRLFVIRSSCQSLFRFRCLQGFGFHPAYLLTFALPAAVSPLAETRTLPIFQTVPEARVLNRRYDVPRLSADAVKLAPFL